MSWIPPALLPRISDQSIRGKPEDIDAAQMTDTEFSFVFHSCSDKTQRNLVIPFACARRDHEVHSMCSLASFYRDDELHHTFFNEYVIQQLFPKAADGEGKGH